MVAHNSQKLLRAYQKIKFQGQGERALVLIKLNLSIWEKLLAGAGWDDNEQILESTEEPTDNISCDGPHDTGQHFKDNLKFLCNPQKTEDWSIFSPEAAAKSTTSTNLN